MLPSWMPPEKYSSTRRPGSRPIRRESLRSLGFPYHLAWWAVLVFLLLLSTRCSPALAPRYEDALVALEAGSREDAALLREVKPTCTPGRADSDLFGCADVVEFGARSLMANARLACAIRYHADQEGGGVAGFSAGVLDWFGVSSGWLSAPMDRTMLPGECDFDMDPNAGE